MTSKQLLAVALAAVLAATSSLGCREDDDPVGRDLTIGIQYREGLPIPGVEVELTPAVGEARTTGADGFVTFPRVPPGDYFAAVRGGFGEFTAVLSLGAGAPDTILTPLPISVATAEAPALALVETVPADTLYAFDALEIVLRATVRDVAVEGVRVRLDHPRLGRIASGETDADGRVRLPVELEAGAVTLAAVAENVADGAVATAIPLDIRPAPALALSAEAVPGGVALTWSRWPLRHPFRHYILERGVDQCGDAHAPRYEVIAEFDHVDSVRFVDARSTGLAREICYRVRAEGQQLTFGVLGSDVLAYAPPDRPAFLPEDPTRVLAHPTDPDVLYLTFYGNEGSRLARYHLAQERVTAEVTLAGDARDLAFADAGQGHELLAAVWDVGVVALDPVTLARRATVTVPGGATSVAGFAEGFVLVATGGEDEGRGHYRTYARATGRLLDRSGASTPRGTVRAVPGRTAPAPPAAVAFDREQSPDGDLRARYFELGADGRFLTEAETPVPFGGSYSVRGAVVAPGGDYFAVTGASQLFSADAELRYLGALDLPFDGGGHLDFSLDGRRAYTIAYGTSDAPSRVVVNEVPSRVRLRDIPVPGALTSLTRLADGRLLSTQYRTDDEDRRGGPALLFVED